MSEIIILILATIGAIVVAGVLSILIYAALGLSYIKKNKI